MENRDRGKLNQSKTSSETRDVKEQTPERAQKQKKDNNVEFGKDPGRAAGNEDEKPLGRSPSIEDKPIRKSGSPMKSEEGSKRSSGTGNNSGMDDEPGGRRGNTPMEGSPRGTSRSESSSGVGEELDRPAFDSWETDKDDKKRGQQ